MTTLYVNWYKDSKSLKDDTRWWSCSITLKNLKTIQKKLDFSNIQGTVSKTTKTLVVKSLVKKTWDCNHSRWMCTFMVRTKMLGTVNLDKVLQELGKYRYCLMHSRSLKNMAFGGNRGQSWSELEGKCWW